MRFEDLNPYHEVQDSEKVATLAESMIANGYTGAPIVHDGYQALTGVHRLAAIREVNARYQVGESNREITWVDTIDIREIWDEAGIAESIDDHLTYDYCDEYIVICQMIRVHNAEVADRYGLDIH